MSQRPKSLLSYKSAIAPVAIGVAVSVYFLFKTLKTENLDLINWCSHCFIWVLLALLTIVVRQISYMWRIKLLSGGSFNWKNCFYVILLWEFASAVTPTLVGGSAVALFILTKEGLRFGKSSAVVLIATLFDELFYLLIAPVLIIIVGTNAIFPAAGQIFPVFGYNAGALEVFIAGYVFIFFITLLMFYGVFINPGGFKKLLHGIFRLPLVRRWKHKSDEIAADILITSNEMKKHSGTFWLKVFGATSIAWLSRFLLANFIILAIHISTDQLLVFSRQIILWVIMLISPTPGGSGIAEITFSLFMKDLVPQGLSHLISISWRIFSYYPYLLAGLIVIPGWLKRVYRKKGNE